MYVTKLLRFTNIYCILLLANHIKQFKKKIIDHEKADKQCVCLNLIKKGEIFKMSMLVLELKHIIHTIYTILYNIKIDSNLCCPVESTAETTEETIKQMLDIENILLIMLLILII